MAFFGMELTRPFQPIAHHAARLALAAVLVAVLAGGCATPTPRGSAQQAAPITVAHTPSSGTAERPVERATDRLTDRPNSDGGERAAQVAVAAMGFMGVPYRLGGNDGETGLDCSGFVRAVFQQTIGLTLPRRAEEQARVGLEVGRDELRPGDLVFFNTTGPQFSHVGIFIGNGRFVHSPRAGARVRAEHMASSYWGPRFTGARRMASEEIALFSASSPGR
jgi:cell wall-associated NlpC family hydrolase